MRIYGSDRRDLSDGSDTGGSIGYGDRTALSEPEAGAVIRSVYPTAPRRIIGLDFGKAADYSALAVADRVQVKTGRYLNLPGECEIVAVGPNRWPETRPVAIAETRTELQYRHLKRWELGTSYTEIVDYVCSLGTKLLELDRVEDAEIRTSLSPGVPWDGTAPPILGVDHTGVGIAVVDMIRSRPSPIPMIAITITGGNSANAKPQADDAYRPWSVPKSELIAPLLVGIQNDSVRIAPDLEAAPILATELQQFREKRRDSGTVTYESLNESDHDDMVIAAAIAAWLSHKIDLQSGAGY